MDTFQERIETPTSVRVSHNHSLDDVLEVLEASLESVRPKMTKLTIEFSDGVKVYYTPS